MLRFSTIVLTLFFASTLNSHASFTLSGTATNAEDGDVVYFYKYFGSELSKIDSAEIKGGEFKIIQKKNVPNGIYQLGGQPQQSFPFVVTGEDINIKFDYKNAQQRQIIGSTQNIGFNDFMNSLTQYHSAYLATIEQAGKIANLRFSDPDGYQSQIAMLSQNLDSLNATFDIYLNDFSQRYNDTYMGSVAKLFMATPATSADNYLKKEDFNNPDFQHSFLLPNKIDVYFSRFLGRPNQQNLQSHADKVLSFTDAGSDGRVIAYISLIRMSFGANRDVAWGLAKKLNREFPKHEEAQNFLELIPSPPPSIGEEAPDIALKNPEGKIIKLSSLRGQVVLLDFWASWCGPCRRENPNVVKAYQTYKDKGFTIYSVSLDKTKDRWVAAIAADGLEWPNHVSDLTGWSSAGAKKYQVTGIPAAFLIDKNGVIVAKNLRGQQLDDELEKLLN